MSLNAFGVQPPELSRYLAFSDAGEEKMRLIYDLLLWAETVGGRLLRVDPAGDPQWGYLVDSGSPASVSNATGVLFVPNTIGAQTGQFVNLQNGAITLADNRVSLARPATHVVGVIVGQTAGLYQGYGAGPVRYYGDGTSRTFWLGESGRATLTAPVSGAVELYQQVLGYRTGSATSGLDQGLVSIDQRPEVI